MIFIHGIGFSSHYFDPNYFDKKKVVLRVGQKTCIKNKKIGNSSTEKDERGWKIMHFITAVRYDSAFRLCLQFEDGLWRIADLESCLDGEMFDPLKDVFRFRTAHLNSDIDTVVWKNGADMSPDFLYKISIPLVDESQLMKVAEEQAEYKVNAG